MPSTSQQATHLTGQFENLLVAVDFSPGSSQAVQIGLRLATSAGARLVLVHVHEPTVTAAPGLRDASPMVIFGLSALENLPPTLDPCPTLDCRLETLQCQLRRHTCAKVETRLRSGDAAAQIVAAAVDEHSDLILMGTHGHGPVRRWLMGSVAETVVRRAPCPVLTLHLPERAQPQSRKSSRTAVAEDLKWSAEQF
jgi:nucleotide-binding universal stress UspA family protein